MKVRLPTCFIDASYEIKMSCDTSKELLKDIENSEYLTFKRFQETVDLLEFVLLNRNVIKGELQDFTI